MPTKVQHMRYRSVKTFLTSHLYLFPLTDKQPTKGLRLISGSTSKSESHLIIYKNTQIGIDLEEIEY